MFFSRRSISAVVVAMGAAMLLTGCNDTANSGQPATGGAKVASTGVTTTSAGGGQSSGGGSATGDGGSAGESPDTAGGITTVAPVPGQMTKPPAMLWDPCDITGADIAKMGFDAGTKKPSTGATDDKNCSWQSLTGKSDLTVVMTRQELRSFQNNPRYLEYSQTTVAGWAGAQFRAAQDGNKIGCYVGISVPTGSALFVTRNLGGAPEEPCAAARRIAEGLIGYLSS